ncbi:uncharacterized protein ACA1_165640 [Acanthamoeba castellanii str. Neff]|uniref:Uncharacterized protein n=1 Tax=Acanthamoeba castellanii (strain ATCC 30010 / Neff) TaxID=1257118 RepID=L8HI31_ACACF|nr:uncharacterized protein ACA1_165640 [Acanthamoeba castellanii str. Neff]ELR24353.1 hypothetical protein ACA1_165640 [Acanthamoeba castellanii str. Neff]
MRFLTSPSPVTRNSSGCTNLFCKVARWILSFIFCLNGTKTIGFYSGYNDTGEAFLFCSGDTTTCLASNSSWTYFGGVLTMEVSSKACPLPSSASSLRWGSSFVALAWAWLTGPSA